MSRDCEVPAPLSHTGSGSSVPRGAPAPALLDSLVWPKTSVKSIGGEMRAFQTLASPQVRFQGARTFDLDSSISSSALANHNAGR